MVSFGKSGGSSNSSYVWNEQTPFLQELYGAGQDLYNQNAGAVGDFASNFSSANQPILSDATTKMGDTSFLSGVTGGTNLGMTTMAGLMNPTANPYLDDSVDNMWSSIGRNLGENILPQQRSEASVLDNYGSSRDQIAEGMAMQEAIRSGTMAETDMRFADYNAGQDRSLTAAGAYTTAGLTADQVEAARLSQIPGMIDASYNLGMTPYSAPYDYLGAYQQTVGAPTILGQGSQAGGFNIGIGN